MSNNYAIYKTTTGRILKIGTQSYPLSDDQVKTGESIIPIPERSTNYYVDITPSPHEVKVKEIHPLIANTATILANGVDTLTITGVHNPSTVTWPDGVVTEVTDGSISFTLDLAGSYTVKIEAIPYINEVFDVTATD